MRFLLALLALLGLAQAPARAQVDTNSTQFSLLLMAPGLHNNNWGALTNTNLQTLENASAGVLAVSTTGGNTNLTQAQATYSAINITGSLTSNATITFPAYPQRAYVIFNNTTGSYSVTLKATGGGSTLVLTAGQSFVFADGVNVVGAIQQSEPPLPVGTIINYAGATAPTSKWSLCTGAAISRTTYSALYAAIGTTYGAGDGSTTFNIPDAQGRVLASPDNGTGRLNSWALGASGGEANHTLTTAEIPSHNHTAGDTGHSHGVNDPGHSHSVSGVGYSTSGSAFLGQYPGLGIGTVGTSVSGSNISIQTGYANIVIGYTGGGGSHNVVQPTLVTNCLIRILP